MGNDDKLNRFKKWIQQTLFYDEFEFNESLFERKFEIYSIPISSPFFIENLIHGERVTSDVTKEEINSMILKENHKNTNQNWAIYFHLPIHDDAIPGEVKVGIYNFGLGSDPPLSPIYYLIEFERADQGGTTYSGILANDKKWCLLLTYTFERITMDLFR